MKRSKIIISSLIALTGVTLVSTVTSTVAWFQNVTRVTAAYTGTTAHCTKMLQVAVKPAQNANPVWKTDLVDGQNGDLPEVTFQPITSGDQAKNTALQHLFASPDYRQGLYYVEDAQHNQIQNWVTAAPSSYAQFELWLRSTDVDDNYGSNTQTYLKNNVYLTDLTIQDANQNVDLAKAVRVHLDVHSPDGTQSGSHKYFLFAKNATETSVGGQLDLNNDGEFDTLGYQFNSLPCIYGGTNLKQYSYASNDASVVAPDLTGSLNNVTPLGSTSATDGEYLKITVTIWLEGWALLTTGLTGTNQPIWDSATYVSKSFNVGMTFGVQPHTTDHQQA